MNNLKSELAFGRHLLISEQKLTAELDQQSWKVKNCNVFSLSPDFVLSCC